MYTNADLKICQDIRRISESVTWSCSTKKEFLKISAGLQLC